MRIDVNYLKRFVQVDMEPARLREVLDSLGLEVAEASVADGRHFFEIEVTPNRPDWLSHYGIAREIAAKVPGARLSRLALPPIRRAKKMEAFAVAIEDAGDCPRYSGCIVRGVKVRASKPQTQQLLSAFGLRPINNLVDLSNLVMLTCGQPLHIFDLQRLTGNEIRVRRARAAESLVLLDGRQVKLDASHLVIADGQKPVALAGIMGGLESGVSEQTRDIFVESAHFGPQVIRRGASSLSLKTDASFRFERGSDVGATVAALRLALGLIAEDQDSHISVSFFADQYPGRTESPPVRLPKDFPARFTGVAIPGATCKTILRRLGFQLQDRRDYWEVMVPSFRVDIVSKEDLVEEIIRVHGYEHLRSELPLSAAPAPAPSPERETLASVRAHLTSLGLSEAINYVFQSPEENELFYPGGASLTLKNPLGRDFSVLKNSLLPGLLHNIAFNLHQGLNGVLLFEIGKVFGPLHGDQEKNYLALALAGQFLKKGWRWPEVAADFHLLKSLLASLFQRLHLGLAFQALVKPGWHPECTFALVSQGRSLGVCGEVSGDCRRLYDNEVPVFAAELELAPLVSLRREERFRMWNRFPAAKRDFSFRIPAALAYDQLRACIEQVRPRELESYELFDVYQGGAGAVSFSLSFTYRSPERTLTSEEVNGLHLRLTGELTRQLGLRPR